MSEYIQSKQILCEEILGYQVLVKKGNEYSIQVSGYKNGMVTTEIYKFPLDEYPNLEDLVKQYDDKNKDKQCKLQK